MAIHSPYTTWLDSHQSSYPSTFVRSSSVASYASWTDGDSAASSVACQGSIARSNTSTSSGMNRAYPRVCSASRTLRVRLLLPSWVVVVAKVLPQVQQVQTLLSRRLTFLWSIAATLALPIVPIVHRTIAGRPSQQQHHLPLPPPPITLFLQWFSLKSSLRI